MVVFLLRTSVQKHSDMVKSMVKQAISNPAIHTKLAITLRKKGKKLYCLYCIWSKDRGESGQHWSKSRTGLSPFFTRSYGWCVTMEITTLTGPGLNVWELTIQKCHIPAFQPHLKNFCRHALRLSLNKLLSEIVWIWPQIPHQYVS